MTKNAANTPPNDVLEVNNVNDSQFVNTTSEELQDQRQNTNASQPSASSVVPNRSNMPDTERITEKDSMGAAGDQQ